MRTGRPDWTQSLAFGNRAEPGIATCLRHVSEAFDRAILLRVGFTRARVTATPRELLPHDFTHDERFGSRPNPAGLFLWHFPSSYLDRTLSCTLPCEARTFLTFENARLPGHLRRLEGSTKARHLLAAREKIGARKSKGLP